MSDNFTTESKKEWISQSDSPTNEQLQIGCLQRIATATEAMAVNFIRMQNDLAWTERRLKDAQASNARMARRIAAYQGVIKKLKKQNHE